MPTLLRLARLPELGPDVLGPSIRQHAADLAVDLHTLLVEIGLRVQTANDAALRPFNPDDLT